MCDVIVCSSFISWRTVNASGMSNKPVYVPRKRRRFHGAFTGGFSAGHFGTVGTEEGWTPAEERTQEQRPEDFMDEQDHNEWGGPVRANREYDNTDLKPLSSKTTDIIWNVQPLENSMGRRLLRLLGWRGMDDSAQTSRAYILETDKSESSFIKLSEGRLRKIQLQQNRIQIPKPKIDHCGLGFEPFLNAPEFRAHHERRKKATQPKREVYRVSDVLGHEEERESPEQVQEETQDHFVNFESIHDFVGSKSVGGFALREDADDTYDDEPLTRVTDKVRLDHENFDTVAYEHHSDDEDESNKAAHAENVFGSVLSSWAALGQSSDATGKKAQYTSLTSDGRPVLKGFLLGSERIQTERFPGPEVPSDYQIQPHQFGPDDHPLVLKALARAVQLEAAEQRLESSIEQALQSQKINRPETKNQPERLSGTVFAGISSAMKSRFVSESKSDASSLHEQENAGAPVIIDPKNIQVKRIVLPFAPTALLCKRFHVSVPKVTIEPIVNEPNKNDNYYNEILEQARAANEEMEAMKQNISKADRLEARQKAIDDAPVEEPITRPPIEVYKSIFATESDTSPSGDDQDTGSVDKNMSAKNPVNHDGNAAQENYDLEAMQNHGRSQTDGPETTVRHESSERKMPNGDEVSLFFKEARKESTILVGNADSLDRSIRKQRRKRAHSDDSETDLSDDSRGYRRRKKSKKSKKHSRNRDERGRKHDKKRKSSHKKSSKRKHDR